MPMNDFAQTVRHWIRLFILMIIILLLTWLLHDYGHVPPEVAPQATIKQRVLSYPYRDGSPVLKAAEKKVERQIDKIIQTWNSTCQPDGARCGAVEQRDVTSVTFTLIDCDTVGKKR
jgi:hypothetical protein